MGKCGRHPLPPVKLFCGWCRVEFNIKPKEYNRQIKKGRKLFFCGLQCASFYSNSIRPGRVVEVEKICPHCNKKFISNTSCKGATFCSRSCASAGSVKTWSAEAKQRQVDAGKANSKYLISTAETLRKREWWKYSATHDLLEKIGEQHQFEFELGDYVFDLALEKRMLLIEFDSKYHSGTKQKNIDKNKDGFANKLGWRVVRINTPSNTIVNPIIVIEAINKSY